MEACEQLKIKYSKLNQEELIEQIINLTGKLNTLEYMIYQSKRERIKHQQVGMTLLFNEAEFTIEEPTVSDKK